MANTIPFSKERKTFFADYKKPFMVAVFRQWCFWLSSENMMLVLMDNIELLYWFVFIEYLLVEKYCIKSVL